jgi:YVTN family beta-propeller protein
MAKPHAPLGTLVPIALGALAISLLLAPVLGAAGDSARAGEGQGPGLAAASSMLPSALGTEHRSAALPATGSAGPPTPLVGVNSIVANVGLGSIPEGVAYDPVSNDLYIADELNNAVEVVSATDDTEVANLPVGSEPVGVAYDGANGDIVVTNYGSANVTFISGSTNSIEANPGVGNAPADVAYDSANGNLYVTNDNDNTVTVLNGESGSLVGTVYVGSEPYGIAYDSLTNQLFVANSLSGNVSVIAGTNDTVVASPGVGTAPVGVAFDPANGDVYVTDLISGDLSVISGQTDSTLGSVAVGSLPFGVAYDSDNGMVYAALEGADAAAVVWTGNNSLAAVVPLGTTEPRDVGFDPGLGTVYVSSIDPNILSVIAGGFAVEFNETGLAPATSWSVQFGGAVAAGTGAGLAFDALAGTYSFGVLPIGGYSAAPSGGSVDLGAPYTVSVTFRPVLYPVTVSETGLVSGTAWKATVGSDVRSTTGSSIVYNLPNGSYDFSIAAVAGYTLVAGGSGTVAVNESPASIGVTFQPNPVSYTVEVTESGLPGGTGWSALVGGVLKSTSGTSLMFSVVPGSYEYQVPGVAGYTASPGTGTITVSGAYEIVVSFAPNSTAPTSSSSSVSVSGFTEGLTAAAAIGAVGLGVGLAALVMSRRSRPPP